jgi:NitT/TauT family transport system permease protein
MLLAIGIWQISVIAVETGVRIVPAPSDIFAVLAADWSFLLADAQVTLTEALIGVLIAFGAAFICAVVATRTKPLEDGVFTFALTLHSLPLIAILPVLVTWFGIGSGPKIALAALTAFYPLLVNLTRGLRAIEPGILDLARVLDAGSFQVLTKIRFFTALPYVFVGLKVATPAAVLGAILGEWVSTDHGLGYRLISAMANFDPPLLWAAITVVGAASLLAFAVFDFSERLVSNRWFSVHDAEES